MGKALSKQTSPGPPPTRTPTTTTTTQQQQQQQRRQLWVVVAAVVMRVVVVLRAVVGRSFIVGSARSCVWMGMRTLLCFIAGLNMVRIILRSSTHSASSSRSTAGSSDLDSDETRRADIDMKRRACVCVESVWSLRVDQSLSHSELNQWIP
jgi:uncharacterized membrane protein YgcG